MSSLDRMKQRLEFAGGDADGRNVKGKLTSFHSALKNSYQAEWITLNRDLVDDEGNSLAKKARCLINPSRLTEQFDKKVISIDYEYGLKEGDVFYWDRTGYYWLVNMQQHTEEAYFRGSITRCEYELDVEGTTYWASLKGPEETSITWRQKHGIMYNDLNYTMAIQVPKNSQTVKYFTRFAIIKVKQTYPDVETGELITEYHRWQVEATDKYSSDGVIDVYLSEYFDNSEEDNRIIDEPKKPDMTQTYIEGPQILEVYASNIRYNIKYNLSNGEWVVNSNQIKIIEKTKESLVIDVISGHSGKFDIIYRTIGRADIILPVHIESL